MVSSLSTPMSANFTCFSPFEEKGLAFQQSKAIIAALRQTNTLEPTHDLF